MSWNPQTALLAPTPESPAEAAARRVRRNAGIAALLLLPALVAAKVLVLSTEAGGRCLMQGGCRPFPGEVFLALLAAVVASGVAVQSAPHRFRKHALAAQLALEALAVLMVLAYP
ncbi:MULTISPECIES: hypothetical protein [unclassified Streptomyces]|uniref:Uncharacterized protein n=1 Tax=Streptomyces sp. R33 TaxID=3238629 RepID=A0AB39Y6Y4_9ACTN|nr:MULTISPECIES: hypothetical protein [unclassified Streptomyces]KJY47857.1 hypothetical protein VR46_01130 [Streptomyces sp. NRRL S-444]KOY56904.1 hypothetical protein ADK59_16600 [Streptomyces sp. XY332]TDU76815.1 hypothetical protein EDD91_3535 [Streptomyces sp. KS 21]THA38400.1 hypothetical protein E6W17_15370 [Streptomyces sp. A1547]